jgi:tRNA (cmo5U34)-methyltransferase
MEPPHVRDHFQDEAPTYDEGILRIVPHYREQHAVLLDLLPFGPDAELQVLDLGCGTGVLSRAVLSAYPRARAVAMDLTPGMLEQCASALSPFRDRLTLQLGDFGKDPIGKGYHLVVSGLAIHHLDDAGKRALYARIFQALEPGGVFLNRDVVLGASPAWTARYEALWKKHALSRGEVDDAWFQRYRDEDMPASVEDQLAWLGEAGFSEVACHWRYLNFAIFGGSKPVTGAAG